MACLDLMKMKAVGDIQKLQSMARLQTNRRDNYLTDPEKTVRELKEHISSKVGNEQQSSETATVPCDSAMSSNLYLI